MALTLPLTPAGQVPATMPPPAQATGSWLPRHYIWSMNLAWKGPTAPWTSPFANFPPSS
jgi:hypothetical protein